MFPKIFFFGLNVLTVQLVLSQTIYNASPACTYPSSTVPTVQSYPAQVAPTVTVTATPLPSNVPVATSMHAASITAVPSPIANSIASIASPLAKMAVSPMPSSCPTEAKAYFVPGPVPDPIVTVLGDIPAVVEVAPKIYPESSVLADPGYIEVKATLCKEPVPKNTAASKSVLPDSSPVTPVKRLSMACASDDPFLAAHKTVVPNHPICPGISKVDLIPTPALTKEKINNPIDFGGLLDGFMTCL